MLAGQVVDPVVHVQPQLDRARDRPAHARDRRRPPAAASAAAGDARRPGRVRSSVTLVPLLTPGVAQVVVAVLLPEARLVAVMQGQPA